MLAVLLGLRMARPPAELRAIFAWVEHLRPWSMVEIYLLGLFVAYVRLSGMTIVDLGPAIFALGALMVVMVVADYTLDDQAVWEAMEPRHRRRRRDTDRQAGDPRPPGPAPASLAHRLRHVRAGQPLGAGIAMLALRVPPARPQAGIASTHLGVRASPRWCFISLPTSIRC